ncbi:unnamed protein product [Didymodactylos carnosus]|uniref:Uncharacterized protein n=1 Tax=Didymodactylos carnosus TaxID=1234261 RepID=A0A814RF01_9BILA|nr:unnamed protein product [Didymodactylos carnosus]CAF1132577.1 unnamed protein product [Didymodactylos carnosus]CAF3621760.1 unnamed protein product [Didymodactylos carnosus]CAF3896393.1 unnamed protein product [Didymodactylos carnosus]
MDIVSAKIPDIRGVFHHVNALATQLRQHVQQVASTQSTNTESNIPGEGITTRTLCSKRIKFKCFQMLTRILCQTSPPETTAKQQLLEYCRQANIAEEFGEYEQLEEFENEYDADKSVYWYTRESFLFRLLSKAARQWDVDVLLDFGFYISNLDKQLRQLHREQQTRFMTNNRLFRVYRGQFMNMSELEKLQNNIGSYISINTFLSTTEDYEFALCYAQSPTDMYENVLFVIDIDTTADVMKSFAHIENLSAFKSVKEVLLTTGTVYRIRSIKRTTGIDKDNVFVNYWKIHLITCNSENSFSSDDFDIIILHLIDILRHLSSKTNTMNEMMLKRCRSYCMRNAVELQKIDCFEKKVSLR